MKLKAELTIGVLALLFLASSVFGAGGKCERLLISQVSFPGLTHVEENSDGSTGGQWFRDATGKRWYIKEDVAHEELQTSAEVMGSLLYRHFGYTTPEIKKMVINGRHYVAIADIGSETDRTRFDDMNTSSVRRLRIVAAFLADYDRIGNKSNNRLNADGSFTLIDFGGAFGSKARGQHKPGNPFSSAIGVFPASTDIFEIMESVPLQFFSMNRETRKLEVKPLPAEHPWRLLNEQDALYVIEQLKELTDTRIASIVSAAGYSKVEDREYMIQALIQRRNTIIAHLKDDYVPLMANGEVPFENKYRLVNVLEVQDSFLPEETKMQIYELQSHRNVSTYSKTTFWRKLGKLKIDANKRRELFLNSLKLESAAIYGLSIFPKGEVTDDFVQEIFSTLKASKFITGHYLSKQEVDELQANIVGDLIGELKQYHGLQYAAVIASGVTIIDTEAWSSEFSSKKYKVIFPAQKSSRGGYRELVNYDAKSTSMAIERGEARLQFLGQVAK